MSFYTRNSPPRAVILKDEACNGMTQGASDASNQAYASTGPQAVEAPDVSAMIKAHKEAAAAHFKADDAHRAAGKEAMAATPIVANAHYAQAKQHFQSGQVHEANARDLQDAKDQGYR